ncbi:MAG TPA: hypothetical protein VF046_10880 [Gemmatimonadales bacterium]
MFIELTDHLRCPADHEEAFLVLLPERMDERSVRSGTLGCPICDRRFTIREGVLDLGDAPPPPAPDTELDADAATTLIGLGGPGGYLVLAGASAGSWRDIAALTPGVALVAVNPPEAVKDGGAVSVIRGGRIPLKSRSMRGVLLGRPFGGEQSWVREAARVVLPGLRVVGEGRTPGAELIDLMADAAGVWVGTARR